VYHVQLRQFPHNLCRFNLSARELSAIAEPWVRGQWIELGERRWTSYQAKLTVLEGERLPPERLTMGRGWGAAQHLGEDVTERVLAAAMAAAARDGGTVAGGPAPGAMAPLGMPAATALDTARPAPDARLASDSLGLELLSQLASESALPLAQAWRLAAARSPGRPASECLALAEGAVAVLLRARLIVLVRGAAEEERALAEHELEPALRALESWTGEGPDGVRVRRV
jgi:hypothetical protein